MATLDRISDYVFNGEYDGEGFLADLVDRVNAEMRGNGEKSQSGDDIVLRFEFPIRTTGMLVVDFVFVDERLRGEANVFIEVGIDFEATITQPYESQIGMDIDKIDGIISKFESQWDDVSDDDASSRVILSNEDELTTPEIPQNIKMAALASHIGQMLSDVIDDYYSRGMDIQDKLWMR